MSRYRLVWIAISTGVLLVILALSLKALFPGLRGDVTLSPGESAELDGCELVLSDFRVPKYQSGVPRQYESDLMVLSPKGECVARATACVNRPFRWNGWWILQWSYDASTERSTTLLIVRDPWLPIAALGGALMLLGSLALVLVFREVRVSDIWIPLLPARRWVSVLVAVLALAVPMSIVLRAISRPDPVPALQSLLMAPHVAAYAASYVILVFAAFGIGRRLMALGFFLMTVGLVVGAVWGKICWGDFWQYDPKEMWSLGTWLVYLAYFAFSTNATMEKTLRWVGAALILLTATWVNFSCLFSGLHNYVK